LDCESYGPLAHTADSDIIWDKLSVTCGEIIYNIGLLSRKAGWVDQPMRHNQKRVIIDIKNGEQSFHDVF
jgi:hypothetical protein